MATAMVTSKSFETLVLHLHKMAFFYIPTCQMWSFELHQNVQEIRVVDLDLGWISFYIIFYTTFFIPTADVFL